MANVLGELFGDIAGAIREKTGETETMKPAEFPQKIREIEAGGGGGTLPAGVYWEQDNAGLPFPYSPRMFMYEGELYAYGRTGTATSTGVLYKLVNGAWSKVGGSYTFLSGIFYGYPIEYNGKVHIMGGDHNGHHTYDKTNGFVKKAGTPGALLPSGAFVQDGKLKAFVYLGTYGDSVYVWDEETDTWELEADFGKSGEVYRMFAVVDGTVYVLYNKQLFTYSDGVLTYVRDITCSGSFINAYSSPAIVVGKYVYGFYSNSGKRLCKVDIENGVQIELGRLPEIYTNGSENQRLFLADRIRLTSKNEDIKNKVSLIMHEVTE